LLHIPITSAVVPGTIGPEVNVSMVRAGYIDSLQHLLFLL